MQIRYLPALVMLIAGAVGCIMGICNHYDTSYMMKMEIVVMIIFFFVGCIAKKVINLVLDEMKTTTVENVEGNDSTVKDNIDASQKSK